MGDVAYLRKEFVKAFCFENKLQVTFQAFDPEWDDFIDVEEGAVLKHKDKVKVVVTPRLSDSIASCSASISTSTDDEQVSGLEFEVTL